MKCKKHNVNFEPNIFKAMQKIQSSCCTKCALEKTKKTLKKKRVNL